MNKRIYIDLKISLDRYEYFHKAAVEFNEKYSTYICQPIVNLMQSNIEQLQNMIRMIELKYPDKIANLHNKKPA